MGKWRFSSRPISNEITMRRYRTLTFAKCTTIMIADLMVTSGGIHSRLDGLTMESFWLWIMV
jgi:hypothetical protein